MILLWNIHNRQICETESRLVVAGAGEEEWTVKCLTAIGSIWGDEVLELDKGDGCSTP